jgi:hypothetical protein
MQSSANGLKEDLRNSLSKEDKVGRQRRWTDSQAARHPIWRVSALHEAFYRGENGEVLQKAN